ncbi:MAG: SET domain-containing protein [Gammaproteobacteria bacterium]|nr:SET domain-containing protein [Gammaproteobacteria bacterium]
MVEVGESGIHGVGLFASQAIAEGTVIGVVEGSYTRRDGPHVLWLDDSTGIRVLNEMRYINHSMTPNAIYYDDLTVVALRDIAPGEEITHHYGDDWQ